MNSRYTLKTFMMTAASLFVLFCVPCFSVHADEVEYIGYSPDGWMDVIPELGYFDALYDAIDAQMYVHGVDAAFDPTCKAFVEYCEVNGLVDLIDSGELLCNVYFGDPDHTNSNVYDYGITSFIFNRLPSELPVRNLSTNFWEGNYLIVNSIPLKIDNNVFYDGSIRYRAYNEDLQLTCFQFLFSSTENFLPIPYDTIFDTFFLSSDFSFDTNFLYPLSFKYVQRDNGIDLVLNTGREFNSELNYTDSVTMFPSFHVNSLNRYPFKNDFWPVPYQNNFYFYSETLSGFSDDLEIDSYYYIGSEFTPDGPIPTRIPRPTSTPTPYPTFLIGTPSPQPFPSSFPSPAIGFTDLDQTISDSASGVNTFVSGVAFLGVLRDLVQVVLGSTLGSYIVIIVTAAAIFFILGFGASGVIRVIRHNDSRTKEK